MEPQQPGLHLSARSVPGEQGRVATTGGRSCPVFLSPPPRESPGG